MTAIYSLTVLEATSWNQGVGRTRLPPEALGENPGEALSRIWWFQMFICWWQHHSNLCLFLHMDFSSSVS